MRFFFPPSLGRASGGEGYGQVQARAADCQQEPRQNFDQKPKASVTEEDGCGVEPTRQRGQESREDVGLSEGLSSPLDGTES